MLRVSGEEDCGRACCALEEGSDAESATDRGDVSDVTCCVLEETAWVDGLPDVQKRNALLARAKRPDWR